MDTKTEDPVIYGGSPTERRSVKQAMWRGMKKTCPQCGEGRLFASYTKTEDTCSSCGLDISGHRADDAPPYFTMLIAGHIVIPIALEVKRQLDPPLGLQFLIWGTVLMLFAWFLLPVTKGGMVGLQWANRMHGFSDAPAEDTDKSASPL